MRTATADMARRNPGSRSFLSPAAPAALDSEGCERITEAPAGVARADGALNGYRTLARCGGVIVEVHEFDYRQPLTQRVFVHLPREAANAEYGSGRAMARYYDIGGGERATALSWYDDAQEVRFYAVGAFEPSPLTTNDKLQRLMRTIVARRAASR